jgi:hypothetical protein
MGISQGDSEGGLVRRIRERGSEGFGGKTRGERTTSYNNRIK